MHFIIRVEGEGSDVRLGIVERPWLGVLRFWKAPERHCVSELVVWEKPGQAQARDRLVWEIASVARCTYVDSVRIGHVPRGFKLVTDKLPMQWGRIYSADAATDTIRGTSNYWFVCRGATETRDWRELPAGPSGRCHQ